MEKYIYIHIAHDKITIESNYDKITGVSKLKPGITGWAQVNGRNAISWQQKFEYDVWYVDNCSFRTDMKILYNTILKVIKSEDINSQTSVTMEPFNGN